MIGSVKIKIEPNEAIKLIKKRMAKGMAVAAVQVEIELIDVLSVPPARSGEVYTRGNITHRASAPGEAPAPDTGALRQSVFARVDTDKNGSPLIIAGSSLDYGYMLHTGTLRMAPRPWLDVPYRNKKAAARVAAAFKKGAGLK